MDFSSLSNLNIFKNNPDNQKQISSYEKYNIWNALCTRYISMTHYNYFINFVHDRDFSLLLKKILNDINNHILILEEKGKQYKINLPGRPPREVKIKKKLTEHISDKEIFKIFLGEKYFELSSITNCIIQSTVNDEIREMFIAFTLTAIENYNKLFKFGKKKGWTDIAPVVKNNQQQKKEVLSAGEAANLWEHINIRYDHIEITKMYLGFVHDPELKIIVQKGQDTLQEQVSSLEKRALEYGLSLPERPPAYNKSSEEPEIIKDVFIYRTIFRGVKNSTYIHINSIIVCTRNDSLKKLFLKLLKEELNILDSFIRYGKMKGWVHLPPMFN